MVRLIQGILLPGVHVDQVFRDLPNRRHSGGTLGGLSLIPVSEDMRAYIGPASEAVFGEFEGLDAGLLAFLEKSSHICPIGYIESRYREGGLQQAAAAWSAGSFLMEPHQDSAGVVSRAIRHIQQESQRWESSGSGSRR